jgi:predicted ATPase
MSELRAETRLCRAAPVDERDEHVRGLRSVLETYTEGFATADLIEAREALESAAGA